jgi:hypothetical protein
MHPARPAAICIRNKTEFRTSPGSAWMERQISNRNTPAFRIPRNSNKTKLILFSNRNITPGVAIRKSGVANRNSSHGRDLPSSETCAFFANGQISNRQFARLENASISLKTKARRDF